MASSARFNNNISRTLRQFADKCDIAMKMYADTKAEQLKFYMKNNRRWVDRTGRAKASLDAEAVQNSSEPHLTKIILAHGVNYGIWLELAHEMNYAIVVPTLNLKAPEVIEGLNNLMQQIANLAGD